MRSSLSRLTAVLAISALIVSSCSQDISSREVMLETLTEQGSLSESQANCVADKMFDSSNYTQDDLDKVASGFIDDDGNEKIPGFSDFAAETIEDCLAS